MPQQTFEYLWSALRAEVPQLPVPVAKRYISDSWLEIQGLREWSFRHKDGLVVLPAEVTTGTISLTQYSLTATLSAAALTAWNSLSTIPLISHRQLRFSGTTGRIYNISSWDSGTGVITLDKVYTGTTNATATYQLYSAYATPLKINGDPEYNFLRWRSLRSIDYGFTMIDSRNLVDRKYLDSIDPGRVHYGLPMNYCYSHDRSATVGDNTLQYRFYEFWPHCTGGITYESRYISKPISFEEDEDQLLPDIIPSRLVISHALMSAYRWAESHSNQHPELSRKNWQYLRAQLASKYPTDSDTYPELLRKAISLDNDLLNQELILAGDVHEYRSPLMPMTLLVNPNA